MEPGVAAEVVRMVQRLRVPRAVGFVDGDDCRQAALLACWQAVATFDPGRGVQVRTFLDRRARGAIVDEWRRALWPRPIRRDMRRLARARAAYVAAHGSDPSEVELVIASGLSARRVRCLMRDEGLYAALSGDGAARGQVPAGFLPSAWPAPDQGVAAAELRRLLERLPARLRFVIRRLYFDEVPVSVVAAQLGVHPSRVSQLHARALAELRGAYGGPGGPTDA